MLRLCSLVTAPGDVQISLPCLLHSVALPD